MSTATGRTATSPEGQGEAQRPLARVGIDATAALSQGAGIGRFTREMLHALASQPRHEYVLFSARPPASPPVPDPLPAGKRFTHRAAPLTERWLYRLWYRMRLPWPVQWVTGRLDLFHSPDFVLPPVAGGIPTLLTVHDLSFLHYPETFTPALVAYLRRVVPDSVRRATHVVADSAATRADLIAAWDVSGDKVTVIYGGVHERFKPVTSAQALSAVRRRYGLGEAPFLLSVGTVQPRKNYRRLIQAFRPLVERFPHHLVIAGGHGWLFEDVLAEAAALGIDDRVHFIGFVDDADLPELYSAATLFLFPSLYEGFGLPVLEAMACGVPVVASEASSLPEVAGTAAPLLPPTDIAAWTEMMAGLLADAPRRARLVAQGYGQAHHFRWKHTARHLTTVYDQLLAEAGRQ